MSIRRIVVVGYADASLLDLACSADTFDTANRRSGRSLYRVQLAAIDARPFSTCDGFSLVPSLDLSRARGPIDTLIVSGGLPDAAGARNPRLIAEVRRLARATRRVVSVCTGAQVLAAAGLLDGRRATTHWAFAAELAQRYPRVRVDPGPLFVRDGDVYTSAGVTSALDLTLALIEDDHGTELAREVARGIVTYLQRPGNQAQMSFFLTLSSDQAVVKRAIDHITPHLEDDLSVATIARTVGVSARHLGRLFTAEMNITPARYVRAARCDAAANLLATTALSLSQVALRCGLGTPDQLRQAFLAYYGITPSAYRRAQRAAS